MRQNSSTEQEWNSSWSIPLFNSFRCVCNVEFVWISHKLLCLSQGVFLTVSVCDAECMKHSFKKHIVSQTLIIIIYYKTIFCKSPQSIVWSVTVSVFISAWTDSFLFTVCFIDRRFINRSLVPDEHIHPPWWGGYGKTKNILVCNTTRLFYSAGGITENEQVMSDCLHLSVCMKIWSVFNRISVSERERKLVELAESNRYIESDIY